VSSKQVALCWTLVGKQSMFALDCLNSKESQRTSKTTRQQSISIGQA
jgi:hypothetical protein